MKVVIAAYACEPSQGSEPAVGWHWGLEAAAAGHDVWVVTRQNNRKVIEAAIPTIDGPVPRFEYVDLPRPIRAIKGRTGHPGLLAYYYLWQIALARKVRRMHRQHSFDIAHHVTFVNDALPSGLCLLPIPFVWGPIGGSTHRLPKSIDLDLPQYARRHERVRAALQLVLQRFDPFVAMTRRRATVILAYTDEALAALPKRARQRARPIIHIGVDAEDHPRRSDRRTDGTLRVLTGGRLVHWKGLDLLIEGFTRLSDALPGVDPRLIVTGDGPYRPTLEALAERAGVGDRVSFVGRLPTRDDVYELLRDADIYALPTLRDGPPYALLEAMACGVPVLCLDIGATAELVPDGAGVKIAVHDRQQIVDDIGAALVELGRDPGAAARIGEAGRAEALGRHDWRVIGAEIAQLYAELQP